VIDRSAGAKDESVQMTRFTLNRTPFLSNLSPRKVLQVSPEDHQSAKSQAL